MVEQIHDGSVKSSDHSLREEVEVPEMTNGLIDEPLDLRKLELSVRR